jgi:hypothetical protein
MPDGTRSITTTIAKLTGCVDRFDPPKTVWGWVRNTENLGNGRDITVRVRQNGKIIAQGPLRFPRPDIIKDPDHLAGFRFTCDEDIADESVALAILTVEAFDASGQSIQLPIYDRTRSFALERVLSASPPMGKSSASIILTCLAQSRQLPNDAKEALLELNDKFFEEEERKLLYNFESIGKDCSLGSMQRAFGAEPIGLWRFSGIGIDHVMAALESRLHGIGSPEFTEIVVGTDQEYFTRDTRYHMNSHTSVFEGNVDLDDFYKKQCRKIGFLARNMIEKLEAGEKILVIHSIPETIPNDKLRLLYQTIREIGPSSLLYLQLPNNGQEPGTVTVGDDGILFGYVLQIQGQMMRPEAEVRAGWIRALRNAHEIVLKRQMAK